MIDQQTQADSQLSLKVNPYKIPSKEERDAIRRSLFEKWGNATPSSIVDVKAHVQAKLTIGAPGDKYEQEADQVASQVVSQINAPFTQQQSENLQHQQMSEEDELQMKSHADTIQRSEILEVEEELQSGAGGMTASSEVETSIQLVSSKRQY
ncbi:MAG: hypothetical protein PUP91_24400 [Rhizonema sp. PD37]|nr:hypothetical protein [Rhizonema sp. PD37]